MTAAMDAGFARIGTIILGAGVEGMSYVDSVNAMADGYLQFLDDFQ